MKTKTIFILLLSIFFLNAITAQDVKVTATANKVVSVGEQFRLTYTVNQKPDGFVAPDLSKFSARGPSTSSSSSVQIINGKVSQNVSYTYTYYLSASAVGKFTIAPAKVKYQGKQYQSNSLTIEVLKASAQAKQRNNGGGGQQQQSSGQITAKDLYARLILNKRNAFVGEQIKATLKIYSKVSLAGFDGQPKFPSYSGFLVQEIEGPDQIKLQRENVGGEIYDTGILQEVLLFPQRNGEITIDPAELTCVIRKKVRARSFFDSGYRDYRVEVKSPGVKVNIKPLPLQGKPADFSGAVGKFNFTAKLDKTETKTNDAINLNIVVSGTGNVKLIQAPEITFPSDFETYKPEVNMNVKTSKTGSSGTKSFKYLIIPRHAGDFRIPPVTFSYFDVASKKYKTISSEQFNIKVEKGDKDQSNVQYYTGGKEAVKTIDVDIRHIKSGESNFTEIDSLFSGSRNFYLIYAISFLIFVVISLLKWKHIKESANIARMKNKKASKVSRKRLKQAAIHLKKEENEQFYDEILSALWGYLSDKLIIPKANLTKDNVVEILTEKGIEEEVTKELSAIIDKCEFAKYAPAAGAGERDNIFKQTSLIIGTLDSKLR